MPWFLAALLAATGAIYYESNKQPSAYKIKVKFPPNTRIDPIMNAVGFVGGTVEVLGNDEYLITLKASTDLSKVVAALPTAPILTQISPTVGGDSVHEFADNILPVLSRSGVDRGGFAIGGCVWDGRSLR